MNATSESVFTRGPANIASRLGVWTAGLLAAAAPAIGALLGILAYRAIIVAPPADSSAFVFSPLPWLPFSLGFFIVFGIIHHHKALPWWIRVSPFFTPVATLVFVPSLLLPDDFGSKIVWVAVYLTFTQLPALLAAPALRPGPRGAPWKLALGAAGILAIVISLVAMIADQNSSASIGANVYSPDAWAMVLGVGALLGWGLCASIMLLVDGARSRLIRIREREEPPMGNLDEHYIQGTISDEERFGYSESFRALTLRMASADREAHPARVLRQYGVALVITGIVTIAFVLVTVPLALSEIDPCQADPWCGPNFHEGAVDTLGLTTGFVLGLGLLGLLAGGLAQALAGNREAEIMAAHEVIREERKLLVDELVEMLRARNLARRIQPPEIR